MSYTVAGETHTDGGIINIAPGGGVLAGSIGLSATLNTLVGSTTSTARAHVTVDNDNSIPDGTVVAELTLGGPTINLFSLIGGTDSNTIVQSNVFLNPKGPNGTLTLHFGGATTASVVYTGGII